MNALRCARLPPAENIVVAPFITCNRCAKTVRPVAPTNGARSFRGGTTLGVHFVEDATENLRGFPSDAFNSRRGRPPLVADAQQHIDTAPIGQAGPIECTDLDQICRHSSANQCFPHDFDAPIPKTLAVGPDATRVRRAI